MKNLEWLPFTEDFDYVKDFYDVLLPNGAEIICFPNGGAMNQIDSDKIYGPQDDIKCRISLTKAMFNYNADGERILW